MPPAKPLTYYPAIDSLRFYAFLIVFLGHCRLPMMPVFFEQIVWYGVELFFLISGFLLTSILKSEYKETKTVSVRKYFIRRVLRIWPLYFTYLICITAYCLLKNYELSSIRVLGNFLFIDNFMAGERGFNLNYGTAHLWSISLEEQFYFLLPFILIWLFRQNQKNVRIFTWALLVLLAVSKLIAVYFNLKDPSIYVLPLSAEAFVTGCMLGYGAFSRYLPSKNTLLLFSAGILILILIYLLPSRKINGTHLAVLYPAISVAFLFIFTSFVFPSKAYFFSLFDNRITQFLGKISFGMYVFHLTILRRMEAIFKSSSVMGQLAGLLIILLTVAFCSALSYYLFEKRFLNLKKKFSVLQT